MTALSKCDWTSFHQEWLTQQNGLQCLSTNISSVIARLAPLNIVRPVKGYDPWLDSSLINLRRKRYTSLRRYLRARANNPHSEMTDQLVKEYKVLHNDFNARSILDRDAFHTNQDSARIVLQQKCCVARAA